MRSFLLCLCSGWALVAAAQLPSGQVVGVGPDGRSAPIPYASVRVGDRSLSTDSIGRFTLRGDLLPPYTVVAAATGYVTDSVIVSDPGGPIVVRLPEVQELAATEVVEKQASTRLDLRSVQAVEALGPKELKRAACCDVSESFETNATVDVSYADAISGAKTIRMLGLDGRYAQINTENVPFIRGLSSVYGLTLIPGPWINEINVSKGIGTAVNGPNAMTGQIELCLNDPATAPALFTNLYTNSQGRTELNVNQAMHLGRDADNVLMVHGSLNQRDMDDNADGFRDQPLTRRINVMDRWLQHTGRRTTQLIARYASEGREGGQTDAHREEGTPASRHYIASVHNELADVIFKTGWILPDSTKSIGILTSFRNHTVSSRFGDRTYEAGQQSGYVNAVYQQLIGRHHDQVKVGAGFQFDDFREDFAAPGQASLDLGRTERMPGAFAEYTRVRARLTVVAGLRADANDRYGTQLSPRLHLKYDLGPLTTLRASVGRGFRSANPLVENAAVMASARQVSVEGPIPQERAWNTGISFLHKWKWLGRKWALALDLYRTDLTEQVVVDLDRSPQVLAIHALHGISFANSLLADVQVALTRTVDLKVSYRWYDVRTTYDGILRERPFTPTHRGLVDVAYTSLNERWRADITWNVFGTARLPDTQLDPPELRLPSRSPAYSTLNAQLTRHSGTLDIYVGVENITSAVQTRQILDPGSPFGAYFDASLIWGPTNGAMWYAGLRHTIARKHASSPGKP